MNDLNTKTDELSSYIREVEAKERSRRRNVFISIGVVLVLGLVGIVSFFVKSSGKDSRIIAYEDLSINKVSSLFEVDNTELIVSYQDKNTPDTIRSVDEYLSMLVSSDRSGFNFDKVSRFETEDEMLSVESGELLADASAVSPMEPYGFAIEGDRKAGSELLFAIQEFDEAITYTLDLGNGVKKKMGKFTRYSYPRPGNFLINLIATNANNATSTNSRFITISVVQEDIQLASAADKVALPAPTSRESKLVPLSVEPIQTDPMPELVTENESPAPVAEEPEVVSPLATLEETAPAEPEEMTGPLIMAQKMPQFPGGKEALGVFLRKKIRYPEEAIRNKIEGKVYLRFVVEANGSVSSPIIVRGIGYGCDQEAIRLANLMPRWTPGQQNGRNVPVYAEFLVNFKFLE